MFVKTTNTPTGIYLQYVESYWNGSKHVQRVVEKIGYLDKFKDQYDDPISHFKEEAKRMTKEKKEKNAKRTCEIDPTEEMELDKKDEWNIGYGFIKRVYKELELDVFWKKAAKGRKIQFDLDKAFQLLVYTRILSPGSKRNNLMNEDMFFEDLGEFSLDDIYNAMDIFAQYQDSLQKWIYDHSKIDYKRDLSLGYFDCTNYYFDVSKPDLDVIDEEGNVVEKKYRKRGPEKNHRPDPIIEMGLLMDKNRIPMAYNLFPGNSSEKLNMLPVIKRSKRDFQMERIVVVADRGLNTSDNIFFLNGNNRKDNNMRDGYIYGQSVRGADAEFKAWVLEQNGYEDTPIEDGEGTFRHKSRIYPRKVEVHEEPNNPKSKKIKTTVDQKQMVYYSAKYAKKQRYEREVMVARAKDLIAHPKKYDRVSAKGASGYVLNINFNKETGEVVGKNLSLDEEKIAEEQKYDGYYSIVTSELEMDNLELRKIYRGLSKIEDTFKVMKSEFKTRPIFHWTTKRIEAHFMTCYTALVILRLLGKKLEDKYSDSEIIQSLKDCTCTSVDTNNFKLIYTNDTLVDLGNLYKVNMIRKYHTRNEIRRMLKY